MGEPLFASYQELLDCILKKRIENPHGIRTVEVAESIATEMAIEEELWLGRAQFEGESSRELEFLERSGLLIRSENRFSISFRHQTVFDFLRARSFLRKGQKLVDYVIDMKRQSLFVRPILWSTLNYLRAADKAVYRSQFNELWVREDLRFHIRILLIKFLGQVAEPEDQEAHWLLPVLGDRMFQPEILLAISESQSWFSRIISRLPKLMTAKLEDVWHVARVLKVAVSFDPQTVLKLVRKFWMRDEQYVPCAMLVLKNLSDWDEDNLDLVCELVDYASVDSLEVQAIAYKISDYRPDLAPKVIVRYLCARIRKIDEECQSYGEDFNSDDKHSENAEQSLSDNIYLEQYERLIDNSSDWYHVEDLARRSPREFLIEIWPLLLKLFSSRLAKPENPNLHKYRTHQGLAFLRETTKSQTLQSAIEIAIRGFAENYSEEFINFLQSNQHIDLGVLQRLLALGLERVARQYPETVLHYLLEDQRRFAIGDMFNELKETQALISAIVPWLPSEKILRLEEAIRNWTWYRKNPDRQSTESRQKQKYYMRTYQIRLLRVFPFEQLSKEGQRHLQEENRALPDVVNQDFQITGGWVSSQMSSEQMCKATDKKILSLFEELTDDTNWDHPKSRWSEPVGGSIQASREFGKFANKSPERALILIRGFQAGKTERPAGEALVQLSKSTIDSDKLVDCIHELDSRGFESSGFRANAAQCLGNLANHGGLSERTCELLESWIEEWHSVTNTDTVDSPIDITKDSGEEDNQDSLLWKPRKNRVIPQGNYPILWTLQKAFFCQNPAAVDRWLGVLERHLNRRENPAVWQEVAEDLWRLSEADRTRAIAFFEMFYSQHPELFRTETGVLLVAKAMPWLPDEFISKIIKNWISNNWCMGPQATGEVLALKLCRNPFDKNSLSKIEQYLSEQSNDVKAIDGVRVGIVYTFFNVWPKPDLRAMATEYLVRLTKSATFAVEKALGTSLSRSDHLLPDDYTLELFEAFIERPAILVNGGYFLIESLKNFLREGWYPDIVYQIAKVLISQKANELGDLQKAWPAFAGGLTDIALTLHRIHSTRECGLDLFERLMKANSYGLNERIEQIDRLAFR